MENTDHTMQADPIGDVRLFDYEQQRNEDLASFHATQPTVTKKIGKHKAKKDKDLHEASRE